MIETQCLICERKKFFRLNELQICYSCSLKLQRLGVDLDEAERILKEKP